MQKLDSYTRSTSGCDGTLYEAIMAVGYEVCLCHISRCAILTAGVLRAMGGIVVPTRQGRDWSYLEV